MSTKRTTFCAAEVNGRVGITHPFHPHCGRELDFVVRRAQWGEDRVFYRDGEGHMASLPASWTSVVQEDPVVTYGAGRSHFRVADLVELVGLITRLRT